MAVIVSLLDGLSVQVRDCGLLVPPNDPAALAEAIVSINQISPEELSTLGIKGRQLVRNAWEDYLIAWEGLLCQLLAN